MSVRRRYVAQDEEEEEESEQNNSQDDEVTKPQSLLESTYDWKADEDQKFFDDGTMTFFW